ncbi:MAG: FG-GAP-like repeat-containing protein [Gemmataceae bacterium]
MLYGVEGTGTVQLRDPVTGGLRRTIANLPQDYSASVRVTSGDLNADNVLDIVLGAGPGLGSMITVIDGSTFAILRRFSAFEESFTGGVFVAMGDLDNDGQADLLISPDEGGGPRVRVLKSANPITVLADFFGIDDPDFRGGARVATGEITGDGRMDFIVVAGFGGGPRVAGWDGARLARGEFRRPFADFFAFEETLRNGVYVAAGDFNRDGRADLVLGAGPGGGPRVLVLNGTNPNRVLGNFFAGDETERGGVRVAARDLGNDGQIDLLTGTAPGPVSRVRSYRGNLLPSSGNPEPWQNQLVQNEEFRGGVFVG